MSDLISRQDAIDALIKAFADAEDGDEKVECGAYWYHGTVMSVIKSLPSADRPQGEWTTEQVAEMLANLFGDECACNFNDIDEWLPFACKYADTQCPHPKEKHGCWMQFLIQGGGTGE